MDMETARAIWKERHGEGPFALEKDQELAHELAKSGNLPRELMTPEVLVLADKFGWTVAHVLAEQGKLPLDGLTPELLDRADKYGRTVADELLDNRGKYNPDELAPYLKEYETPREVQRGGRER